MKYGPISLPSVLYKIFTKVILNTIRDTLDINKPRQQARYKKGYSKYLRNLPSTRVISSYSLRNGIRL